MTLPADTKDVTCPICKAINRLSRLLSTHAIGSPDLDLRPPPDKGKLLQYMIESCESCAYVARYLDDPPLAGTQEAMASLEWKELINRKDLPPLAVEFKRGELIRLFSRDLKGAVWMAFRAIWVADDQMPSASPSLRKEAALLVEKAMAEGTPVDPNSGGNEALLADLLRRSGDWKAAEQFAKTGILVADNSVIRSVLALQIQLVEAKDGKAHKIEEAGTLQASEVTRHTSPTEVASPLEGKESHQAVEARKGREFREHAAIIQHQEADPALIRALRDVGLRSLAHSGRNLPEDRLTIFLNSTVIIFCPSGFFAVVTGWRNLGVPEDIVSLLFCTRQNLRDLGIDLFHPSLYLNSKAGPAVGPAERSFIFLREFHRGLKSMAVDAPDWIQTTNTEIGNLLKTGGELERTAGLTSEVPKIAPLLPENHGDSEAVSIIQPMNEGELGSSSTIASPTYYPIFRTEEPSYLSDFGHVNLWELVKHSDIRTVPYWNDSLIRKHLGNPDFLTNAEGTILDLEKDNLAPSLTRLFLWRRVEAAMQLRAWRIDADKVRIRREARERAKQSLAFQKKNCILCEREQAMKSFDSGWRCKYCGYETPTLD